MWQIIGFPQYSSFNEVPEQQPSLLWVLCCSRILHLFPSCTHYLLQERLENPEASIRPCSGLRENLAFEVLRRQLNVLGLVENKIWEVPKIRDTFLGVPITRTIVCWGLYWGPRILGNYHIAAHEFICGVDL